MDNYSDVDDLLFRVATFANEFGLLVDEAKALYIDMIDAIELDPDGLKFDAEFDQLLNIKYNGLSKKLDNALKSTDLASTFVKSIK